MTITYARDAVDLAIVDGGRGAASANGGGYGLAGMRERVAIYGGQLESGARPEGGYAPKTHVASVLSKLGLRNRVQAVVLAYETGLVKPGA